MRPLCVDAIWALSLFVILLLPLSVFRRFSHLPQRPTFTNSYSIAHKVDEEVLSGCSTSTIQKLLFPYFNFDLVSFVDSSTDKKKNNNKLIIIIIIIIIIINGNTERFKHQGEKKERDLETLRHQKTW